MLNLFQNEVIQFDHVRVLFKRYQLMARLDEHNVRAFFPNLFEVPSMQTMRFLPFIPWLHWLGMASKGGEELSVGSVLAAGCLAYGENMKLFMKRHMRTRHLLLCSLPETLGSSAIKERT